MLGEYTRIGRVNYLRTLPPELRKALNRTPSSFTAGDGTCPGCGGMNVIRLASRAINLVAEQKEEDILQKLNQEKPFEQRPKEELLKIIEDTRAGVFLTQQTGCIEVCVSTGDMSAVKDQGNWSPSWQKLFTLAGINPAEVRRVRSSVHDSFSDGASTLDGAARAYQARYERGEIKNPFYFWNFAGDGGGTTIGVTALSGFLHHGWGLYVLYDNRGYMNTGAQQSATTLLGEHRTTTPVGDALVGNWFFPKDMLLFAAAHGVAYAASASMAEPHDLMRKVIIAIQTEGPTFIWMDAPCPREWGFMADQSKNVGQIAIDTGIFRIAEYVDGTYIINRPRKKEGDQFLSVREYFKTQKNLKHLLNPQNVPIVEAIQKHVDESWQRLGPGVRS